MCKHLPVFVVHLKQVCFVIVVVAADGYALLWKLSLDLVYPELSKSPNGQTGRGVVPQKDSFKSHNLVKLRTISSTEVSVNQMVRWLL